MKVLELMEVELYFISGTVSHFSITYTNWWVLEAMSKDVWDVDQLMMASWWLDSWADIGLGLYKTLYVG